MKYKSLHNQYGFTLVQAIFILVVLALLGAAMVKLLGGQTATATMAVQQAKAYQAAHSGLEWGTKRASVGSSCSDNFDIDGFHVVVDCQMDTIYEGATSSYPVYRISANASFGNFGSSDYISRTVQMKVGFP